MSRESAFRDFRWNNNVICVRDEAEMEDFRNFLEEFDQDLASDFDKRIVSWERLELLAPMNGIDPSFFLFEVHDAGEYGLSLTFSGAEAYDECCDYYGLEPIEMADLIR